MISKKSIAVRCEKLARRNVRGLGDRQPKRYAVLDRWAVARRVELGGI